MKKIILVNILILTLFLGGMAEADEKPGYGNLSFIVWKSDKGLSDTAKKIGTLIPDVLRESWLYRIVSVNLSKNKPYKKIFDKDNFRFELTIEHTGRLKIKVIENDIELFEFGHRKSSSVRYLFHGADGMVYMIEAIYSIDNHAFGLVSPGIIKG